MHLSTFLTLAATASTFAVPASARLDRRSASHRNAAHSHLVKRTASPEPFRAFPHAGESGSEPSTGSFAALHEGIVALRKRDDGNDLLEKIGDVVNEVAVAWKLALPDDAEPVTLAAATTDSDAAAAAAKEAEEKAAAEKKAAEEKAAAEAAANKKAAEEAAAEAKAKAEAAAKKKAAKEAAKKKAAEEAAAQKKAEELAAEKKAAAEARAKKIAEAKAAMKAAAEEKAAEEAAAKKAEEAAAKKAAEEKQAAEEKAAAQKAAAEKNAAAEKKAAAEKQADLSTSNIKLAKVDKVADISNAVSLIGFHADNCGASGATDEHPNGSLDWLNCGISKSNPSAGWTPPNGVTLARITTVSIEHALANNHVWEPCRPYVKTFDKVANELGLPAILLASFALQESTCNENTMGGGGEVGLMQITPDKCQGRSAAACRDPEFNIRTAASYFKQELDNQGGQFLKALGAYNGWYPGLSYNGATAARYSGCCTCQNNLDYLFQMTNGWLIGKTGYELKQYANLAVCGYQS
ncbi:hypothetical protein JCM8547_004551 [Rhodosporidiobolus lusitaniae]